jgi:NAD(P)-dependent dehydrogenase (short-subunit alcohol dehydrogenase family)
MTNFKIGDLFSVEGKTIVITGGAGFLGKTMTTALLENGARVVVLGRSDKLKQAEVEWRSVFGDGAVRTVQVDMYDIPKLDSALNGICNEEASIDVLINNAHELGAWTGFNVPSGSLETADYDQWHRHFLAGNYWPSLTISRLLPAMKRSDAASIINISTMYAIVAPSPRLYEGTEKINPPGYSASKAGMLALTRYAASFLGQEGIRANAILPGPFSNTGGVTENSVNADDPFLGKLKERTCLDRIGKPGELVGAILFLASSASSYVTGQAICVDGGWTVT